MNKGDRVAGEFIADEKAIWQVVVPVPTNFRLASRRRNQNNPVEIRDSF